MKWVLLLTGVVLVGCGSSSHQINPRDLTGNWTGVLNPNDPSNSESIDMFVSQSGSSLNAPVVSVGVLLYRSASGTYCDLNGTMSGTSMNEQISMTVTIPSISPGGHATDGRTLSLNGKPSGNTVSGTYNVTSGCTKGVSGTFQISPAPSFTSSQWSGTYVAPFGTTGTASANLTEDSSGKVAGTVTLDANACDNFGNGARSVTGAVNGRTVGLSADLGGTIYGFGGDISADGKTLHILHTCGADSFYESLDATLTHP